MINQKRGLSDVVTVSLIILLAIAAVVIVWTFVRPTLESTGKEIAGGNCLAVEVKVVSCTIPRDAARLPNGPATVVVENGPGQTTVDKVKLVYYQTAAANSNSEIVDGSVSCDDIGPLARKTCTTALAGIPYNTVANAPAKVGVAAVLGERTCPVSTETVTCS
ncbi:MAG: hypothetical protein Q7S27_00275 [Nanoarchaeota archaeon]|nr:hypothetical protein [Nanoarchaeota archaeon]